MTPEIRRDAQLYLQHARAFMVPASFQVIGAVIFEIFETYDQPAPSETALKKWFEKLAVYPEWALRAAADDLVTTHSYRPNLPDLIKRILPQVGGIQGTMMQAQMLLDYGTEPEPRVPASEEQKAKVREILGNAGVGIRKAPPKDEDED